MTSDDDLLADVEFDLIDESDPPPEDVFARQTAIPAAPPEQMAADIMLQAESAPARPQLDTIDEGSLTPPPVRSKHLTPATLEPPPSEDLEFDSFDAPIDVFGDPLPGTAPERQPGFGQSEVPTAPPVPPAKSPRPHAPYAAHPAHAPSPPARSPSVEKLTQPVRPRERPAFMVETTRNRPPSPEMLARATPRGGTQRGAPNLDTPPDSALDFVQGLQPSAASVQPVTGRHAPAPAPPARAGVRELEECYAVGDYTRALQIAEQMLARSPDDVAARRYAQNCRDVLTQMFAARIGPLDQIITVVVSPQEVQWLALDHRAGFLLSLVDGQSTVDEILDISGMTRLDALKILHDLTEQQVVKLA